LNAEVGNQLKQTRSKGEKMLRLFISVALFAVGCAPQDNPSTTVRTTVNFVSDASVHEAISLFESGGIIPQMSVRIAYPDHESEIDVGNMSADDAANYILQSEQEQLEFLVTQFNPDDIREASVYEAMRSDLDELIATDDLQVGWIATYDQVSMDDPLIESIASVKIPIVEGEIGNEVDDKSIHDYTGDASWVPAGGTSTIYTSGTLQKFWMDADSADAFNSTSDGIEIDTLIKYRSYATCGSSVSSNMPDYYKDTEFGDGGNYRNCSVGTISANQLSEDTLYWTWFPFASFNSSKNPRAYIQFQDSTWCSWIFSRSMCVAAGGAWCMCKDVATPYNPQWLIAHSYNDAPGIEVEWEKD